MKKTMIILTKSRKLGKSCVAGIDYNTSKWIRLINSCYEGGGLADRDLLTEDGTMCGILDVVEVECTNQFVMTNYHPENVQINDQVPMKKVGHVTWDEVASRNLEIISDQTILHCERGYSYCNMTDLYDKNRPRSLQFLHVHDLTLARNEEFGKIKTRAHFTYRGAAYGMVVTDPEFERGETGTFHYGEAYLIVSRGLPFNSGHYSLVAKVVPLDDINSEEDIRVA